MNGTNGNEPGYPENALVPYPVIVAATKGDPDAMKIVLQHFSGYIARLSMRKLYDERGNVYFGVDHDIRERLQREDTETEQSESKEKEERPARGSIHEKLQIYKEKSQRESETGKETRKRDFGLE